MAVLFPIKTTTCLQQRTNRLLAIGLLIFACSFYTLSFPVITTRFRSNTTSIVHCEEDREKLLLFPFLVLDTLFTFIIPFSLITLMNVTIVYKLQTKLTYQQQPTMSSSMMPILYSSTKSLTNLFGSSTTETLAACPSNMNNNKSGNTSTTSSMSINESHRLLTAQYERSLPSVRLMSRSQLVDNRCLPTQRHSTIYQANASIYVRSTHCRATASAKTTKMLLAASTVFLVFNLPYHFLLLCFLFIKNQPSWMFNAVNVARLWFFASFCVNFFVYTICGQRFRSEIVRLFSCSFLRRYSTNKKQNNDTERQNSIYLSHRLMPFSLTNLARRKSSFTLCEWTCSSFVVSRFVSFPLFVVPIE
jgi:plasmid maintenance system killer protein